MTTSHKVTAIACGVAAVLALFVFGAWLKAHDAWKDIQADLRVSQARIKTDANTVKTEQKVITAAESSNSQIDADTKKKLDSLQRQLDSKPDSSTIRSIVEQAIPGVKTVEAHDDQGNKVLAVADTQANRDAINQKDVEFKSCRFNLDDCQQKQANFEAIIDAQKIQLAAKDDTIKTQAGTIKEYQRFGKGGNIFSRTMRVGLPIACAAGGAYLANKARTDGKGAAIGAATGGTLCAFSFHF
jgi:hypothetical protein